MAPLTYDFAGSGVITGDFTKEGGTDTVERVSGQGRHITNYNSSNHLYVYTTATSPNDGYGKIKFVSATNDSSMGGAYRCTTDGSGNGYSATISTNNNFGEIHKWTSGTPAQLEFLGGITPADGDIIELVCTGSSPASLRLEQNGNDRGGTTDSSYTSGNAGFHYRSSGGVASSSYLVDDFEASEVIGGGADIRRHIIPAYMRINT